jgi:hypothetical protein
MRKFVITMLKIHNYELMRNYDLKNLTCTLLLDVVVLIYNADSPPPTPPPRFYPSNSAPFYSPPPPPPPSCYPSDSAPSTSTPPTQLHPPPIRS